jgi:uncharacterized membrane protein YhhN
MTSEVTRRFAQTFVLFCAAQAWVLVRTSDGRGWLVYAALVTACVAGTLIPRLVRPALALTFGCVVFLAAARFPRTANHLYLQCFVALVLTLTNLDDDDQRTALVVALRRIVIAVFFWSGVQKIVHGAYVDGSFLCWNLVKGTHDAWRSIAHVVLPAEELANVARAQATNECRFVTPFGLALANSVYVSEIACAAVLAHPRTRERGAIVVGFVLMGIEVAMSEWVFAAFAANLLLLCAAPQWSRRARPLFIAWAILVALLSGRP